MAGTLRTRSNGARWICPTSLSECTSSNRAWPTRTFSSRQHFRPVPTSKLQVDAHLPPARLLVKTPGLKAPSDRNTRAALCSRNGQDKARSYSLKLRLLVRARSDRLSQVLRLLDRADRLSPGMLRPRPKLPRTASLRNWISRIEESSREMSQCPSCCRVSSTRELLRLFGELHAICTTLVYTGLTQQGPFRHPS